jgi:hypothetical protein
MGKKYARVTLRFRVTFGFLVTSGSKIAAID